MSIGYSANYYMISLPMRKKSAERRLHYRMLRELTKGRRFKTEAQAQRYLNALKLPAEIADAYVAELFDICF